MRKLLSIILIFHLVSCSSGLPARKQGQLDKLEKPTDLLHPKKQLEQPIEGKDKDRTEQGRACLLDIAACKLDSELKDIVSITHFLNRKGVEKNLGKDFDSGIFIIEDKGFLLFNKLKAFVESNYRQDLCQEVSITDKLTYPRKSTHFNNLYLYKNQAKKDIMAGVKKTDCNFVHYGIDVKKGELPMKKRKHILFGRVGTINGRDLTFIKLERSGLKGIDALSHGLNLAEKIAKRFTPQIFRGVKEKLGLVKITEKKLEEEFKNFLDVTSFDMGESSSLTTNRTEHIPAKYLAYFIALMLKTNVKDFKEVKAEVKAFGLQAMIQEVEKAASKFPENSDVKAKLNAFVGMLKEHYPNDYYMRFGNEIIIRASDLLDQLH